MSMKKELWLLHLFFFGGTIFTIDGRLIRGSNADTTPASSVLTRVSRRTTAFFQQGSAFWFYRKMVPLGVVSAPLTRLWTSTRFPGEPAGSCRPPARRGCTGTLCQGHREATRAWGTARLRWPRMRANLLCACSHPSTLAERRFKGKTVNDAKTVTAGH